LRTPVKQVFVIMRNPSPTIVQAITGQLKTYVLSELNAWEFIVVDKKDEEEWIKLGLTPNFAVLGRKLGKKMRDVKKVVEGMSHHESIAALEAGKIDIGDVTIDTSTEIISKLSFAKTETFYEATTSPDGSMVVAVNCTQDESTLSAGQCREFINIVQQLRKSAGLDLTDVVEVFHSPHFKLGEAIQNNVELMKGRLRGIVPLEEKFRPPSAVVLGTGMGVIAGEEVRVVISRKMLSYRDGLPEEIQRLLETMEVLSVNDSIKCQIDGVRHDLAKNVDYWESAADKAKDTKACSWL